MQITVNHTTREYLERFVQKKKEKELQAKLEASQAAETEVETAPGVEAPEPVKKPAAEVPKTNESTENQESDPKAFGIVNDEDKEKDDEAQKKLASLLDERYTIAHCHYCMVLWMSQYSLISGYSCAGLN